MLRQFIKKNLRGVIKRTRQVTGLKLNTSHINLSAYYNSPLSQINRFSDKNNNDFQNDQKEFKKMLNSIQHNYNQNKNNYFALLGFSFAFLLYYLYKDNFYPEMNFSEFENSIEAGLIDRVKIVKVVKSAKILHFYALTEKEGTTYRVSILDPKQVYDLVEKERGINEKQIILQELIQSTPLNRFDQLLNIAMYGIFTSTMLLALFKSIKSGKKSFNQMDLLGVGNHQQSRAVKFTKEMNVNVKFKDVAGMDQAKLEITEFVDFLKNPSKYKDVGAKLPTGALLAGPPGTGKTLLAKACAGESGVPFYFVSGSEFMEMFVGVGAARVRSLFKEAKENSPSIIFIDEIDAIGKKRSEKLGGSSEADATLNQLLVEMDGFGTDSNVIVFAATNRKELLDPALLRPGRFDRAVDVELPDIDGRKDIFKVHLAPIKLEDKEQLDKVAKRLASLTPGFSGAEISNICNEAAIAAVRNDHPHVTDKDFELAVERVIGGLEKRRSESEKEKKVVAVHESGHGVVAWFLEGAAPLLKLTIIPRSKGALGFAQYLPTENSLETKEELMDRIVSVLGGRCAEEEFFGEVTTGAYDDLQKAYRIAHSIVTKLGMSEKVGFLSLEENEYGMKSYSGYTNKLIDEECKLIIDECTEKCRRLIKEHRDKIEKMSDTLLEQETIDLKIIKGILGERPFKPKGSFKAYLEEAG